ncbi:MAG: tetratricopeptide repeat protein [Saprospiraceae bacterium]|nr:tetratricopeptide repeat protein [Saprospiraceae bacterium]
MEGDLFERARLLYEQNREKEALEMVPEVLRINPEHLSAKYILASIYLDRNDLKRALPVIESMIAEAPYINLGQYLLARYFYLKNDFDEAELAIREAVRIEPEDADSFAMWAQIVLVKKDYEDALRLADKALEFDPRHTFALNIRSKLLIKLKRVDESTQSIEGVLNENPDDSFTHANVGWIALERGDHKNAEFHFKEALRSNPANDWAKSGLKETLKANFLVYRWFLKYSFWISNMKGGSRWVFIIAIYLGLRFLGGMSKAVPMLAPLLIPILFILVTIILSSWFIHPISDFILVLHPHGKYLLDREEKNTGIAVGAVIGLSFISLLIGLVSGHIMWYMVSISVFVLIVFIGKFYVPSKGKYILKGYVILMVFLCFLSIFTGITTGEAFNDVTIAYLTFGVLFTWISNFLEED